MSFSGLVFYVLVKISGPLLEEVGRHLANMVRKAWSARPKTVGRPTFPVLFVLDDSHYVIRLKEDPVRYTHTDFQRLIETVQSHRDGLVKDRRNTAVIHELIFANGHWMIGEFDPFRDDGLSECTTLCPSCGCAIDMSTQERADPKKWPLATKSGGRGFEVICPSCGLNYTYFG